MRTTDDRVVSDALHKDRYGYMSLYNANGENEIPAGSVLCSLMLETLFFFQTSGDVKILSDEQIEVLAGTVVVFPGGRYDLALPPDDIEFFNLETCRFPTQEELEWYDKVDTV